MNLSKRSVFLIGCDVIAVVAGFWGISAWHYLPIETTYLDKSTFYFVCLTFLFSFYIFDLYYPYKLFGVRKGLLLDIGFATALAVVAVIGIGYWDRSFYLPRLDLLLSTFITGTLVCLFRYVYNMLFRSKFFDKKALVIGAPDLIQKTLSVMKATGHTGIEPVGWWCPEELATGQAVIEGIARADLSPDTIASVIGERRVQLVIFAFHPVQRGHESAFLPALLREEASVITSVQLIENLTGAILYEDCDSDEILNLVTKLKRKPYLRVKRLGDILVAGILLFVLGPLACLAAALLGLTRGAGQILFIQERAGADGRPFKLIKLRSMKTDTRGDLQITRVGYWIRKYRIDEIPQLLNILRGDMSLIGPRPETPHFMELCEKHIPHYRLVYTLKPGLTGWAQVHQSHVTSLEEYAQKLRYNLFYIKNLSLKLDLEILFKTVRIVLRGMGK